MSVTRIEKIKYRINFEPPSYPGKAFRFDISHILFYTPQIVNPTLKPLKTKKKESTPIQPILFK